MLALVFGREAGVEIVADAVDNVGVGVGWPSWPGAFVRNYECANEPFDVDVDGLVTGVLYWDR